MSESGNPIPYEGKENYIFVSYSHMDSDKVMPVIRRWLEDGYRVWYDDGISPGTEWPEVIAQHLNDCELFVAFLSNSYMDSFNCKREIDFAVRKRKNFLTVFLEETELSLGVEMQISTVQSVDYYKTTPEIFHEKFYQFDVVKNSGCRMVQPQPVQPVVPPLVQPMVPPLVQPQPVQPVVPPLFQPTVPPLVQPQPVRPGVRPAVQTQPVQQQPATPAAPRKKVNILKILIPVLLGVLVLFGVAGVVIGVNVSKAKKKTTILSNSSLLELADTTVNAKSLRKAAKKKDIRRIKMNNCELDINDKAVWAEILNENVYEITITGCQLTDEDAATILSNAPGLRRVDFSDNKITSISFGNNPKLETAHIRNNNLSHIDKTNLENLRELYIEDNAFADLDFLQTAIHLQTLTADRNNLESVDVLKNCALLSKVCISENNISDVTALKASKDTLRDLNLSHNKINDISVIGTMPELKNLDVDNNLLVSLYLVGSEKLSYLSARNNLIDSLNGDWDELTYIDVADNNLSGDYLFLYSTKLRKGFFENNNITELAFYGEAYRSGSFSIYNNPLADVNFGEEKTSYDIYVSYNDDIGPDLKTKLGMNLYLLDCPYDQRVEYEDGWGRFSVSFPEQNEIVEAVEKLRKDF